MAAEVDAWRPGWRVQRLRVLNQWQEWQMRCSHEARSWPTAQCACCWVRSFPAPYQGEVKKRKPESVHGCQSECSQCGHCMSWQILLWLRSPKITRRIWKRFSFSKEGDVQQYAARKSLRKKKPRTRAPKISVWSLHVSCSTALKKQCTQKAEMEAVECTKLLA